MPSLFGGFGCFFLAILVFMVIGFQRGWKREVISLVFVLLASVLIRPNTSDGVGGVLAHIPALFQWIATGTLPTDNNQVTPLIGGPIWSLLIYAGLVILGYFVGDKVMPKPANPQERFIGVIPSVLAGVFIMGYLTTYYLGQNLTVDVKSIDPGNFVPVIIMVAILALVVALISARIKKTPGKK